MVLSRYTQMQCLHFNKYINDAWVVANIVCFYTLTFIWTTSLLAPQMNVYCSLISIWVLSVSLQDSLIILQSESGSRFKLMYIAKWYKSRFNCMWINVKCVQSCPGNNWRPKDKIADGRRTAPEWVPVYV